MPVSESVKLAAGGQSSRGIEGEAKADGSS